MNNKFIISLAGRDRGRVFVVIDHDENYVTLADGMLRSVEKPKRKKLRHIRCLDLPAYDGPMTNCSLAKAVKNIPPAYLR